MQEKKNGERGKKRKRKVGGTGELSGCERTDTDGCRTRLKVFPVGHGRRDRGTTKAMKKPRGGKTKKKKKKKPTETGVRAVGKEFNKHGKVKVREWRYLPASGKPPQVGVKHRKTVGQKGRAYDGKGTLESGTQNPEHRWAVQTPLRHCRTVLKGNSGKTQGMVKLQRPRSGSPPQEPIGNCPGEERSKTSVTSEIPRVESPGGERREET